MYTPNTIPKVGYNFNMEALKDRVQNLMEQNHRSKSGLEYTVPSPEIYPFQWLWDSCFHAIILSSFDLVSAKREIESVVSRPLPGGLLPHIIYWEDPKHPLWGRELRGDVIDAAWGTKGTSAITQPPLLARAAFEVFAKDKDIEFLKRLYPRMRAHYMYLIEERTFSNDHLAYIINPDESGEDNSPRFDGPQELIPVHSALQSLDKRIMRMEQNAACKFDARGCMCKYFAVADVTFNVVFTDGLEYLALIADVLDLKNDRDFFKKEKRLVDAGIRARLHMGRGEFYDYDSNTTAHAIVKTWSLFMPLFGGLVSEEEAQHLVCDLLLNPELFWTPYPVPSTAKNEPAFDPGDGFWRGPVWIASNWFVYRGLRRYGYNDVAEELRQKTVTLIEVYGFREHYNPITGEGLGAHDFTWGGLVLDMFKVA